MKKHFLALSLSLIMCLPFMAYPLSANAQSSALVKTNYEPSWSFSIPADATIPYQTESMLLGSVTPTELNLEISKAVRVSVTSSNNFYLVRADGQSRINYSVNIGSNTAFAYDDMSKSLPVNIHINKSEWDQAGGGHHSDILTFIFSYENK